MLNLKVEDRDALRVNKIQQQRLQGLFVLLINLGVRGRVKKKGCLQLVSFAFSFSFVEFSSNGADGIIDKWTHS